MRVTDAIASATDLADAAETGLLERLREMGADLRECAILGPGGRALAATDGAIDWAARAAALWAAAADSATAAADAGPRRHRGRARCSRCAPPAGLARRGHRPRFALASLMFCDLRAALRELEAGRAADAEAVPLPARSGGLLRGGGERLPAPPPAPQPALRPRLARGRRRPRRSIPRGPDGRRMSPPRTR